LLLVDSIGAAYTATLAYGDDYKIFLGIPNDPPTNLYTWYKDGQPHSVLTGQDYLQLSMLQGSDEGVFTCLVTNPDSANFIKNSRPVRIRLVSTCRERDSLALVALYNSANGHNWLTTWDLDQSINTWHGITLSGGCVNRIILDKNYLEGEIPYELGALSNLSDLRLWDNQLIREIPPQLGNLTNLEVLYLFSNSLTGEIPPELGYLKDLNYLFLYNNDLSGEIPSELRGLSNLTRLYLNNNDLGGEIPSELGSLTNLTHIYLASNKIRGDIPPELGSLTNLTNLRLSNNQLTGEIPSELGSLTNLTQLWLQNNQLKGEIPPQLGNLTHLTDLILSNNDLSGNIPPQLGNLTHLDQLAVNSNDLSGEIPSEVGRMFNLKYLILSNNKLSGEIPYDIGELANLLHLLLNNNELIGEIPSELSQLSELKRFYMQNNHLSGCFPEELMTHCLLGFNTMSMVQDGYNLTNNPGLPWDGDFERFCNGDAQIGAPCDDENPASYPDIITQDCGCHGLASLGYFLLGSTKFCLGGNSAIDIIAGGGYEPFEIIWQGDTTNGGNLTIETSSPGSYPLIIRDAQGNEVVDTITFEMIPPIVLERVIEKEANRSLELILSGGTGNYTVLWSNGATGKKIFNLLPGLYSCTVTDDFGCSMSFGPFEIGVVFDEDNGGPGHTDVDPLIQPLIKGSVASQIDKITIPSYSSDSMSLTIVPFLSLSVHPNPTNGLIQVNMLLENEEDTDLIITDLMGTAIVKIRNHGGNVNSTIDLSNYPDGVYLLIFLTDKKQIVHRLVKS